MHASLLKHVCVLASHVEPAGQASPVNAQPVAVFVPLAANVLPQLLELLELMIVPVTVKFFAATFNVHAFFWTRANQPPEVGSTVNAVTLLHAACAAPRDG
ncbi:hypothetical protein DX912_09635 [Lysobacter soli]|uniref:Uncharacterized protein n=1 Tax=Lysobacter soli TaxID=453783 RepID=A0A3D8VE37_9GAMM|nr:hypothetical protein DX912_09635 [Lysobacter soli]